MKNKKLDFNKTNGLIPAIIQDFVSQKILMLGYINEEALEKTKTTGVVYFWSRKRKRLWLKGEKSGNKLLVKRFFLDCDRDALLIQVELLGQFACHLNRKSCFSLITPIQAIA